MPIGTAAKTHPDYVDPESGVKYNTDLAAVSAARSLKSIKSRLGWILALFIIQALLGVLVLLAAV